MLSKEEQRFGKLTLTNYELVLFSYSAACILIFFAFVTMKECLLYSTPVVTDDSTAYKVSPVLVKLQDIQMFLHSLLCLDGQCTRYTMPKSPLHTIFLPEMSATRACSLASPQVIKQDI